MNCKRGGGEDMTKSIPKIVCGAFALYLSLVILIGYYLDYFGFSLTAGRVILPVLTIFICYIGFNYFFTYKHTLLSYEFDKTYIIIFFIIFIVGFIYFLLPSLPSFLPLGSNVDAPQAYAITKLIADGHSLLFHGRHIYLDFHPVWQAYPPGLHLNVAVLSWISNISPIKLLYPFICLIIALSIAGVYGIVVESKITENKYLATIPSFLLVTFVLLNLQMRLGGPFPRLFGAFLVIMFVWYLMDYVNNPSLVSLIPLILVECAVIHSYTTFSIIPIAIFTFALIFEIDQKKIKIPHFILFTSIVIILSLSYLIIFYNAAIYLEHAGIVDVIQQPDTMRIQIMPFNPWLSDESIYVNLANLVATLFFALSILGFVMHFTDKKAREIILFYGVTGLQILTFLALLLLVNMRLMPVNNTIYVLMYPAAMTIFLGIKKCFDIENISKKFSAIAFVCMILLTFATAPVMSLGCSTGLTGREAGITQDEYDTALWVKNNIGEDVAVVADPGAQFFFFIASEQENITLIHSSYKHLDKEFKKWQVQAKSGDIVVVLNIYKVGSTINLRQNNTLSIDGTAYDILYHKGVCYVLRCY
jgi:hypothetical protein